MADNILNTTVAVDIDRARLARLERIFSNLSKPIQKNIQFSGQPLGKISGMFSEFDKSLDAATARVLAFTGTTGVIYGVGAAFRRVVKDFLSVETALAGIQSITKSSKAEMKGLASQAFALSNSLSIPFADTAQALQEFARQGLSAEKAMKATAGAAVIAKLSGTDLKQAIDGLVATTNSFTKELLEYGEVANTLVSIDAKFATSAGGLIEGIKRVGSVASEAGLRFGELAATIAAVKQVSGRSEAIIGNALKTIFTNLQTDRVQKELESLGITTKDAAGNFAPLVDVMKELSLIYDKLSDSRRSDLGLKIAGKFQINQFKALVSSFKGGSSSLFNQGLEAGEDSANEAENRLAVITRTTESSFVRLSNNLTQLGAGIGEKIAKPVLDTLTRTANNAIEILGGIFSDSAFGKTLSDGIAGALSGPGIIIAGNAIARLAITIAKEFALAAKSISGLNKVNQSLLTANQGVTGQLREQNSLRAVAITQAQKLSSLSSRMGRGNTNNGPSYDPFETNFYGANPSRGIHPSVYAKRSKRNFYPVPGSMAITAENYPVPGKWVNPDNSVAGKKMFDSRMRIRQQEYLNDIKSGKINDQYPKYGYIAPDRARNNISSTIEEDNKIKSEIRDNALFLKNKRDDEKRAQDKIKKDQKREKYANRAFVGSFALPFVGSAIANGALGGRDTKSGRLTEDITNAGATGLSVASLGGGHPVAIAAGLAIGAVEAGGAIRREKYNPKDQIDRFEKLQSEFTAQQNIIQNYVEALNNVSELKTSGASLSKIQKAREQSQKIISALSGSEAEEIGKLGTDTEALAKYASLLGDTQGRKLGLTGLSATIAETSKKYNESLFGSKKLKNEDSEKFAKGLVGSIDTGSITSKQLRGFGKKSDQLTKEDFKDLGLDSTIINEVLTKLNEGFEGGVEDFDKSVKAMLLSVARFKDLDKVGAELDKARINVEGNITRLAKAYIRKEELTNIGKQSIFQRNISLAKNTLSFESDRGFINEEASSRGNFTNENLELQNRFNQDTRGIISQGTDQIKEVAKRINSDEDRGKALELLPQFARGDISVADLAKKFEEIANSFKGENGKDLSSEFRDEIDKIIDAGEKLRIEFETRADVLRDSYELERKRISNAKLSTYGGAGLSVKDFLEKLTGSRNASVPFSGQNPVVTNFKKPLFANNKLNKENYGELNARLSQDAATQARANIERRRNERELGGGLIGFADSDLTPDEILKKREEEKRLRDEAEEDHKNILQDNDRQVGVARAQDEITKINKLVPGGIGKDKNKEIISALQSGDPAKALEILDGLTRRGKATTRTVRREDGSVRTFAAEDSQTKQLREVSGGLSGFLDSAIVSRRLIGRRTEIPANKDAPSSEIPEGVKTAQKEAADAARNAQVSVFADALAKDNHLSKLDTLDSNVRIIIDNLNKNQNAANVEKEISDRSTKISDLQGELDKLKPETTKINTSTETERFVDFFNTIDRPKEADITTPESIENFNIKKEQLQKQIDEENKNINRVKSTGISTKDQITKNLQFVGGVLSPQVRDFQSTLSKINLTDNKNDDKEIRSALEKNGLLDKGGELRVAIQELINIEKQRQETEKQKQEKETNQSSKSDISVGINVSAADAVTKAVLDGGLAAQIAAIFQDKIAQVLTETTGGRPALRPTEVQV